MQTDGLPDDPRRSSFASLSGRRLWIPVLLLMIACVPGRVEVGKEAQSTNRYFDLLRRLQLDGVPPRKTVGVDVWTLDGDSRAVLSLHPPDRLEFGPFSSLEECVLRFGMGQRPNHWNKGDGVEFRVSIESSGRATRVFAETFRSSDFAAPRWVDREIPLPVTEGDVFKLVLETDPGPSGDRSFDHAGWSHPHLICRNSATLRNTTPNRVPLILLISIDTLRRDHLGVYGYDRATSPTIDRFAQEAMVFDNCFAPAPYTLPSHGSLLTGAPPSRHLAGFDFPEAPLADDVPTLAERLQAAGYWTVALTAGGLVSRRFGLSRGFEEWRELQRANLRSVIPAIFDLLGEDRERPLFFFLHTYDVHGPYQQPEGYRFFTRDSEPSPDAEWRKILDTRYHDYQNLERFHGVAEVVAAYDSGIRFVDSQLERLFDYLKDLDLYDRSIIVITSDHGESLFEAGRYFGHSHTLEDRELAVPLLLRAPGASRSGRSEMLAELMDVAPTLLGLIQNDEGGFPMAQNLLGAPIAEPGREDPVIGGSSHLGATYARSSDWKLISPPSRRWEHRLKHRFGPTRDRFRLTWQLYNLRSDRGEQHNLYEDAVEFDGDVRRLANRLREERVPGRLTGEAVENLDPGTEQRLRALGYVQ